MRNKAEDSENEIVEYAFPVLKLLNRTNEEAPRKYFPGALYVYSGRLTYYGTRTFFV
jgi:hypothetical protein